MNRGPADQPNFHPSFLDLVVNVFPREKVVVGHGGVPTGGGGQSHAPSNRRLSGVIPFSSTIRPHDLVVRTLHGTWTVSREISPRRSKIEALISRLNESE